MNKVSRFGSLFADFKNIITKETDVYVCVLENLTKRKIL